MNARLLLSTLLLVAACTQTSPSPSPSQSPSPSPKTESDAAAVTKAGAAIGHDNVMTVTEALASAATLNGKSVRISGTIQNVCQKKGCWMELAGEKPGESVRITAKDYGFFFPISARGQKALIEGELAVSELSPEDAQHIENEKERPAGEEPKKIEAPVKEISVVAVGAEISQKNG